ncbi:MAG: hypothetical protein P8L72_01585 [Flavobacteriaceae bacterium]|nr:hypothetical protein [Flavobacteriaceae bacterium]MDG2314062.1 hypothetical protein [Flavobacteriaceae bacterium]
MIKSTYINKIAVLIAILFAFGACEERIDLDYSKYEQPVLVDNDGSIVYQDVTSYPVKDKISSDAPTFEVVGSYQFLQPEIEVPTASTAVAGMWSIDPKTGVITYDNKNQNLSPGDYVISVRIANSNGVALHTDLLTYNIEEVPITLQIDNAAKSAGIFEQGAMATLSYTDTSEGLISSVSYALSSDTPSGFSVDESTGVISKVNGALSGENKISVVVTTNLGVITFNNVLTVTVGAPPTIELLQQDGTTSLQQVTLSPNTAYTSKSPNLVGMTAASWDALLPDALTAYSSSFSIDNEGKITILADANLPVGTYLMGAKATNASGNTYDFNDILTLKVEERWETTPVYYQNFDLAADAVDPNIFDSSLSTYRLNGSVQNHLVAFISAKNVRVARVTQAGGETTKAIESALVLALAVDSDWKKLRVSFNEAFGYGNNRLGWYERYVHTGTSTSDLESGIFTETNWSTLMAPDDTDWSSASLWGGLNGDSTLNSVPSKSFDVPTGTTNMYVNWRVVKTGTATGGANFMVDEIKVEVSTAFTAEEQ